MNDVVHTTEDQFVGDDSEDAFGSGVAHEESEDAEPGVDESEGDAEGACSGIGSGDSEVEGQDAGEEVDEVVGGVEVHAHDVGGDEADDADEEKSDAEDCRDCFWHIFIPLLRAVLVRGPAVLNL